MRGEGARNAKWDVPLQRKFFLELHKAKQDILGEVVDGKSRPHFFFFYEIELL